jgi:hypothetical protein
MNTKLKLFIYIIGTVLFIGAMVYITLHTSSASHVYYPTGTSSTMTNSTILSLIR